MKVNGEDVHLRDLPGVRTLAQLVCHYNFSPQSLAVELNGHIPDRDTWEEIVLKEEDRLELIRFVGGG